MSKSILTVLSHPIHARLRCFACVMNVSDFWIVLANESRWNKPESSTDLVTLYIVSTTEPWYDKRYSRIVRSGDEPVYHKSRVSRPES